jgi:hypothetical protein
MRNPYLDDDNTPGSRPSTAYERFSPPSPTGNPPGSGQPGYTPSSSSQTQPYQALPGQFQRTPLHQRLARAVDAVCVPAQSLP